MARHQNKPRQGVLQWKWNVPEYLQITGLKVVLSHTTFDEMSKVNWYICNSNSKAYPPSSPTTPTSPREPTINPQSPDTDHWHLIDTGNDKHFEDELDLTRYVNGSTGFSIGCQVVSTNNTNISWQRAQIFRRRSGGHATYSQSIPDPKFNHPFRVVIDISPRAMPLYNPSDITQYLDTPFDCEIPSTTDEQIQFLVDMCFVAQKYLFTSISTLCQRYLGWFIDDSNIEDISAIR
eukprot:gene1071-1214_t